MNVHGFLSMLDIQHSDGHTITYGGTRYPAPYQSIEIGGEWVHGLRDTMRRVALIERYTIDVTKDAYLDIGCNLGAITVQVGRSFGSAWGIDKDPHLIDVCRVVHHEPNVEFDCCAVEDMRGHYGFDLITALSMIENVRDHGAFVEKVYRMLAPNGAFVCEGHSADVSSGRWLTWDTLLRGQKWEVYMLPERTDPGRNSPYIEGRPVWICRKQ